MRLDQVIKRISSSKQYVKNLLLRINIPSQLVWYVDVEVSSLTTFSRTVVLPIMGLVFIGQSLELLITEDGAIFADIGRADVAAPALPQPTFHLHLQGGDDLGRGKPHFAQR